MVSNRASCPSLASASWQDGSSPSSTSLWARATRAATLSGSKPRVAGSTMSIVVLTSIDRTAGGPWHADPVEYVDRDAEGERLARGYGAWVDVARRWLRNSDE